MFRQTFPRVFHTNLKQFASQNMKTRFLSSPPNTAETLIKTVDTKTDEPKRSILNKWIDYWKNIYRDYKSVAIDVSQDIKSHPRKSLLKLILFSVLGYTSYVNPSEENYFNLLLENKLRLVVTPDLIRNQQSNDYVHNLETLNAANLLHYANFGLFSIVYFEDYSEHTEIFKKQCTYVQPSYLNYVQERIVDVGFYNFWFFMNRSMKDYDVSSEEWKQTESLDVSS